MRRPTSPRHRVAGSVVLAAVTAASLAVFTSAVGALPLRVRARTRIATHITRTGRGVELSGTLRDLLGQGIPGATLHVAFTGLESRTVATARGAHGAFILLIANPDVRALEARGTDHVPWNVRYEGDASYGPATAHGILDLHRDASEITLDLEPDETSLLAEAVWAHVAVHAGRLPIGHVPVRLQVGDGPELVGQAGLHGRLVFFIRPNALRRPGRFTVRARWSGDRHYAAAHTSAMRRLLRPTRLTLRVGREGDAVDGRYRFSGRLSDDRGPMADAAVAIVAHVTPASAAPAVHTDSSAASAEPKPVPAPIAVTDDRGVFLVTIPARRLLGAMGDAPPGGVMTVRAIYQAGDGRHATTASPTFRVALPGPPGLPSRWYATAVGGVFALVLLAWAVRQRLWRVFAEAFARRRRRRHRFAHDDPTPPLIVEPVSGPAPRPDWFVGRIVDTHSRRPIDGARLTLAPLAPGASEDGHPEPTGCAGASFAIGPLSAGRWRLMIGAPGYLPRHQIVSVPHDGAFDGAALGLVSTRTRLRDIFGKALDGVGGALHWGHDTPAEALASAREHMSPPAAARLGELRELIERAWFAPGAASSEDVARAEAMARDMLTADGAPPAADGERAR